jgi:hypothetical protein
VLAVLNKWLIDVTDTTTSSSTNCQPPIVEKDLVWNRSGQFQKAAIDDDAATRDKVLSQKDM